MGKLRARLLCGAAVAVVAVVPGRGASAADDVFGGRWTSTDTDGSKQVLTVRGAAASRRAVTLYDDRASVCGGSPAQVSGTAVVDGAVLDMKGALTCLPRGNILAGLVGVTWIYDQGTDTLVDGSGVVWSRA